MHAYALPSTHMNKGTCTHERRDKLGKVNDQKPWHSKDQDWLLELKQSFFSEHVHISEEKWHKVEIKEKKLIFIDY